MIMMLLLLLAAGGGIFDCGGDSFHPPGSLGVFSSALSQALLVLRARVHHCAAFWLSHEELTKFEGRLGRELAPPGAVCGLAPEEPCR